MSEQTGKKKNVSLHLQPGQGHGAEVAYNGAARAARAAKAARAARAAEGKKQRTRFKGFLQVALIGC